MRITCVTVRKKYIKNEDGTLSLVTNEFRFRCTMENGQPVYAEITSIKSRWQE